MPVILVEQPNRLMPEQITGLQGQILTDLGRVAPSDTFVVGPKGINGVYGNNAMIQVDGLGNYPSRTIQAELDRTQQLIPLVKESITQGGYSCAPGATVQIRPLGHLPEDVAQQNTATFVIPT